ncbi:hypothetical protein PE36_05778 [Moritella sp. PE36]|uniref:hypothetical protein n=1 Tax=Moritella sp. PE36 TaxID=58051 RepID=UPI000156883A|nr:hypothetical protein [Moritella sp. PE36]EDM67567.1 hypothetical protein PE36_05778 [Moritella sp. PE36]
MRYIPLIIFICLLNQGCSTNYNLPINQPTSTIQALAPAAIEDATEVQPISVDDFDEPQIHTSDVVDAKGNKLEEPKTEELSGELKNMSDAIDFMPKPRSYWM